MKPEHLYYKEVNARDGAYYRRWASVYGPCMSEFIDRVLKSSKHEEQSYNACNGLLHKVKDLPHGIVEEAARTCIEMNACRYSAFKRVLGQIFRDDGKDLKGRQELSLPFHENIRGKDYYR